MEKLLPHDLKAPLLFGMGGPEEEETSPNALTSTSTRPPRLPKQQRVSANGKRPHREEESWEKVCLHNGQIAYTFMMVYEVRLFPGFETHNSKCLVGDADDNDGDYAKLVLSQDRLKYYGAELIETILEGEVEEA